MHSKELIIPKQQRHLLTTLADICGKRGSLLDVGCFEGQFLRVAQSLGWQVTGTEISAEAANFARSQWQLDVRQGTLETLHFDDAQFDAVVLNDVIEHLPDPLSTLHEIQRILRPKGVLYLWTPNFDSLTRRLAQKRWGAVIFPWHLYYFSAETLAQTCQRASLTPVSITTRNWLLDFGDRYQALTSGQPLQAPSTLRRRFTRLIDKATAPLFAAADRRDHHWGAQLALFAQK